MDNTLHSCNSNLSVNEDTDNTNLSIPDLEAIYVWKNDEQDETL